MSNLQILSKSIRTFGNLHCLNDCHQASGSAKKHQPALFVRLETTQELIAEIQNQDPTATPLKTLRGTQGGTYACKELVIAYAAWISPAFHLTVLRAFLNQVENSQNPQPNLPLVTQDFKQAMIKLLNYASQYEQFQRAICTKRGEAQQKQVQFFFSEIAGDDSYLFIFRNNISEDIQKASEMLYSLVTR